MPKQYCRLQDTADDKTSSKTHRLSSQRAFAMENVMRPKLVILTVIAMTSGFLNLSASAFTPGSPMGTVVPLSGATRTIPIDAKTKYVNVTAHETVKFVANGNAFAINFSGGSTTPLSFVPSARSLKSPPPACGLHPKSQVLVALASLYNSS